MRVPPDGGGYDHRNPLRNESAEEAARIDGCIAAVWKGHPRRFFVESEKNFMTKAALAMNLIAGEVPACCLPAEGDLHADFDG